MAILSQHRRSGMTGGWIVVLAVLASVAGAQQFRMDDRTIRVAQDFRIAGETETVLRDIPGAAGDTSFSCQPNPDNEAFEGIICVFSDLTGVGLGEEPTEANVVVAESFFFQCNGDLTGLTWWGFMIERAGQNMVNDCTLDIAPAEEDFWTIRYYQDDGDGFPDPNNIIAEFIDPPGITRIDTGEDPFGIVSKFEIHFDFPEPVAVEGATLYHVEVFNNYTFNDCFYCWQSGPPGDIRSLQTDFDPKMEDLPSYDVEDINDFDVAQCQDLESIGPVQNPPGIKLSLVGVPDVETGCCTFRFTVQNRNCIGTGVLETFYVAFAKGDAPADCEDIADISPPTGWDVDFCEEWSDDGRAIYRFTGNSLGELESTSGMIKMRVNGDVPVVLDPNNTVPADGVRAWASKDLLGEDLCGTETFGPLEGEAGEWGVGHSAECPFVPIPAMSAQGKGLLLTVFVVAGLLLVLRSRKEPVAV